MLRSLLLSLVLVSSVGAQTPGSCRIGQAAGTLDINDVEVGLPLTGTIAYGPTTASHYYVPRKSRLSPLYAAAVWIGGTVGGEFRVAGATYGQGNDYWEFWPGPLNEDGTLPNPSDCSTFDRVWVVSVFDLAEYERGGDATADLAEWPVGLGAPAVDAAGAPVVPTRRDQTVDLGAGERPVIYGSQTAFWVMNDVGNEHRTSNSAPLGIEVAVSAFAILSADPALNQATFYRYAITNRNHQPIEDARLSVWADPDLGNASDDFIGVDTTRSLAYVYNADENDDGNYGPDPPAWGVDVLGGLADDPDQKDLTSFIYMTGGDANRSDPRRSPVEFARVMRGVWPDGTPMTAFGNGYNTGGDVTTFAFPGRYGGFWSEENNGSGRDVPADRRFALSTGPGTIPAGETRVVDLAFLFAQRDNRLASVMDLMAASDSVQVAYRDGRLFLQRSPTFLPLPPSPIAEIDLRVEPNPARGPVYARVRLPGRNGARLRLFDVLGRTVADFNSRTWPAGETRIEIDAARLAPGVYTAVLDVLGVGRVVRRVTVVR